MIGLKMAKGARFSLAKRLLFLAAMSAARNVRVCSCSSVANKKVV